MIELCVSLITITNIGYITQDKNVDYFIIIHKNMECINNNLKEGGIGVH